MRIYACIIQHSISPVKSKIMRAFTNQFSTPCIPQSWGKFNIGGHPQTSGPSGEGGLRPSALPVNKRPQITGAPFQGRMPPAGMTMLPCFSRLTGACLSATSGGASAEVYVIWFRNCIRSLGCGYSEGNRVTALFGVGVGWVLLGAVYDAVTFEIPGPARDISR